MQNGENAPSPQRQPVGLQLIIEQIEGCERRPVQQVGDVFGDVEGRHGVRTNLIWNQIFGGHFCVVQNIFIN